MFVYWWLKYHRRRSKRCSPKEGQGLKKKLIGELASFLIIKSRANYLPKFIICQFLCLQDYETKTGWNKQLSPLVIFVLFVLFLFNWNMFWLYLLIQNTSYIVVSYLLRSKRACSILTPLFSLCRADQTVDFRKTSKKNARTTVETTDHRSTPKPPRLGHSHLYWLQFFIWEQIKWLLREK